MPYTIGVEIADSQIRAALLNTHIIAPRTELPADDLEFLHGIAWSNRDLGGIVFDVRRQIEHTIRIVKEIIELSGISSNDIRGIGVNVISAIDSRNGKSIAVDTFQAMPVDFKQPLIAAIRNEFHPNIKVDVHNRSQAGAYGEFKFGLGQSHAPSGNLVYITISYYVNMGVVVNRELYGGSRGLAGQFSHIIVEPNGPLCPSCHQNGCLWFMASGFAMARDFGEKFVKNGKGKTVIELIRERDKLPAEERYTIDRGGAYPVPTPRGEILIDGRAIVDAAQERDSEAIEIVERSGTLLGRGIAQVINFFNPDIVVLGAIAARSDVLRTTAERVAKEYSLSNSWTGCSVQLSAHDDKTPIIGSALLARP